MARAEEAEADFETVDGCIRPYSGKRRAEKAEAVIETVYGTRILIYPGKKKQYYGRSYPFAEFKIASRYSRYMLLRYGHLLRRNPLDFSPIHPPNTDTREKKGVGTEREVIAAAVAGSSGVAATVGTTAEVKGGSFFKHPAADPSATGTIAEAKGGC